MRRLYLIPFERWNAGLIALLAFMIPVSTAGTNGVLIVWISVWMVLHILHGDLRVQISSMLSEPVTRAVLLLLGIFVLAGFYSIAPWSDIRISLGKMSKWLYLPFLIASAQQSKRCSWVMDAFLCSMALTLFLAMLKVYGGITLWCVRFTDACVFKDHIFTNLMMSFAAFILAHRVFQASFGSWKRVGFCLLCATSIYYVLFMSEGRSGYIMFILLWVVFCVQTQKGKYRIIGLASLLLLLAVASFHFSAFQRRIVQIVETIPVAHTVSNQGDSSIRHRVGYLRNSLALIKTHPWFGFGTGSFKTVYEKQVRHDVATLSEVGASNPHNEYLNIAVQCGMLGLGILLWFFYVLYKNACFLRMPEKYYAQGLVAVMVVGCIGNSWLMDFTSGCFFMVCLAACLAAGPVSRKENVFCG